MQRGMERFIGSAIGVLILLVGTQTLTLGALGQQPIEIEMRPTKTTIMLGEPLWVDVTMTNRSTEPLIIDYGNECYGANPLQVEVEGAARVQDTYKPCGVVQGMAGSCLSSPPPSLNPGESITRRFVFSGDFRIVRAGVYRVRLTKLIRYQLSSQGPPSQARPIDTEETGVYRFDLTITPASPTQLLGIEQLLAEATSQEVAPPQLILSPNDTSAGAQSRRQASHAANESYLESADQKRAIAEGLSEYPVAGMEPVFQSWIGESYTIYGLSALKRLNTAESRASLAKIAKGEEEHHDSLSENMRWEAVDALADLGDKRYLPLLEKLAHDGNPDVRDSAIEALGRLGGERELVELISLARNGEFPYDRVVAVRGISETKSLKAVPVLIDLVNLPESSQPNESYFGLSLLTHLDFPPFFNLSIEEVQTAWRKFWEEHKKSSVAYGRYQCRTSPSASELLLSHTVRPMQNPGLSLSISIPGVITGPSRDVRVGVELKNESTQEVRPYFYDAPTEYLHISIWDANGKLLGCEPPFVDAAGASPGPVAIPPGETLSYEASFREWACPNLAPGQYSLRADWDLDDADQNLPSSTTIRIASNTLRFVVK